MERLGRATYMAIGLLLALAALMWRLSPPSEEARLAQYVLFARRDPILALPGTDLGLLSEAVAALETSSRAARPNLHGEDMPLYPFAFIAALAQAEDARRALLKAPGTAEAVAYHAALAALLDAYERDLSAFERAVRSAPADARFAYLSGSTTAAFVADSLARARENAQEFSAKESRRFACQLGKNWWCPAPPLPFIAASMPRLTFALTRKEEAVRDALRSYDAERYPGESHSVLLSSSACYPGTAPMPYDVAYARSRLTGIPMVWPRPLNDLYFFDLARADRPSLVALREAGLSYEYEPWSAYLCPDAGVDLGAMLTVLYVRDELLAKPLKLSHAGLRRAQERFLHDEVPSEASFMALASYASHALSAAPASEEAPRLEELVLLSRTRTAQFERVVGYFDDLQIGTRLFFSEREVPAYEFALSRSGLSPLLLLYSGRSPVLLTEAPGVLAEGAELGLRSYRNDLALTMPFSAIAGMLSLDLEVREKLYGARIEAFRSERAP